uniref:Solute carrier organic anion transporter family member n=1 Tax=Strongyloides papillosus TaxID=174720 RepID=A0A0N5BGB6_STREA
MVDRLYIFLGVFGVVYFLEAIGGSYMVSAIQSIERQFQIPSKLSGFLVSASDIGYVPTVIFISYFGSRGNRAKWIGAGTIVIALAHIWIAMPNFIFPVPKHKLNLTEIELQLKPSPKLLSSNAIIEDFLNYLPIKERLSEGMKSLVLEKLKTGKDINIKRLEKTINFNYNISNLETDDLNDDNEDDEPNVYTVDKKLMDEIFFKFSTWLSGHTTDKSLIQSLQQYASNRLVNPKDDISKLRKAATAPFAFCGKVVNNLREVVRQYKCQNKDSNFGALTIMFFSLLALGVGRTMPWCLGIPLIDDNVKKKSMPVYFAGISFIRILGPISGFLIGSACNRIYYTFSAPPPGLTAKDPTWIGAWWLGFLIIGIVAIFPSLILFFFPSGKNSKFAEVSETDEEVDGKQKKTRELTLFDKHKVEKTLSHDEKTTTERIKHFLGSYKEVLDSKVYLGSVAGRVCDILAFKGYMVFLPKYLENHYGIPQYKVHQYMAAFGVFGFALGTITGGFITRRFKLTGRQAAIMVFIISVINCSLFFGKAFLGCHSIVNSVGRNGIETNFNYTRNCNADCGCESATIFPVCDAHGNAFYSPCHAGCRHVNVIDQKTYQLEFSQCDCAQDDIVKKEYCKDDCKTMVVLFFATVILGAYIAGSGVVPGMLLLLRSVPPATRSISLGLQGFLVSLIGTLPSPIIWGIVIDSTCLVWEKTCNSDSKGSCTIYNPDQLRWRMHILYCIIRIISMTTDLYVIYHAGDMSIMEEEKSKDDKSYDDDEKQVHEMKDMTLNILPQQPLAE